MIEYSNYIILAIDNARGGTLADLIKKMNQENKHLTDDECSNIMKGIF